MGDFNPPISFWLLIKITSHPPKNRKRAKKSDFQKEIKIGFFHLIKKSEIDDEKKNITGTSADRLMT